MIPRILIAALSLGLAGCAEHIQIHFVKSDIQHAVIDPRKCYQQKNGDLLCRDVVVRLNRIGAR